MQCKDIEEVLENEGLAHLPESVRAHAATCSACSGLISDFSAILSVAEQLPAEVEPPTRVWVSLRNQLEAEGIIKSDSQLLSREQPSWFESLSRILSGRAVATAAVGLVIVAAAFVQIGRDPRAARNGADQLPQVATAPQAPIVNTEPLAETGQTLRQEEQNLPMVQPVGGFASADRVVDNSFRQNLASLNLFIEDCRRRLKEDPNDELAREYLAVAYQQKAELLSAMLDRGRSVN
ncbi:MAG: hypothetical protein JSS69_12770 [Acidobacteria bacterium]|nr:hypothetical protein [Acidobacteriota bacterium]MBS1866779.1 hypothetical protein [Acidobacteriota bacterium]